MVCIRKIN